MSTIFLTVSKRAIDGMKDRAREAADRGPVEGILDGPQRLSVLKRFMAKPKANRQARRRRTKGLRKRS